MSDTSLIPPGPVSLEHVRHVMTPAVEESAPEQPDPYAGPCGKNALVCGTCSPDCEAMKAKLMRDMNGGE